MKKLIAALCCTMAITTMAQTAGDYATFRKAAGVGDVKTYTAPVNSSLFSLNGSGTFALLAQSNFANASHTHTASAITDFNSVGDARWSLLAHVHTFASLTSKPTTIAGYGITDFNTLGDARWALLVHTHAWGSFTGTLSDQTDLQTQLETLANSIGAIVTQTITNGETSTAPSEDAVFDALAGKSDVGHTHTFASLTSKPTTVAGYGITDFNSLGDARWSLLAHTHTFASLTSTPTTLSGYGITDAQGLDADLTAIAALTTTSFGRGLLTETSASTLKGTLSLGNVENTALSTWAGSTNITTLGTITAGTWTGTTIAVANGGTGATSASSARTNLGVAIGSDVQAFDADLSTYAGITPSANVQTLLGSANYSAFRSSLGVSIGSDVQAFNSTLANIAAGTWTGASSITTLGTITTGRWHGDAVEVAYGGTAATTASSARDNLGLKIGTDVQAAHSTLLALSGVAAGADRVPYFTGASTMDVTGLTSFARTVLDDPDAATMQATLGFAPRNPTFITQTASSDLTGEQALGALGTGILKNTTTTGVLSIAVAGDFPTLNQSTTGSAATLTTPRTINGTSFDGSGNITVTAAAGTLTGTTLNSTVVSTSITSTGTVASGTWSGSFGDSEISALAGTTSAANKVPYYTGSGSASTADFQIGTEVAYSGTITWTATVAPSSTANLRQFYTQVGNLVTWQIMLTYATAGTVVTNVSLTFPTQFPAPVIPTGFTGASVKLWNCDIARALTTPSGAVTNGTGFFVARNSADTGFEISGSGFSSGSDRTFMFSGSYFTQ